MKDQPNHNQVAGYLHLLLNELDKYPANKRDELFGIGLKGLQKASYNTKDYEGFKHNAKLHIKREIRDHLNSEKVLHIVRN